MYLKIKQSKYKCKCVVMLFKSRKKNKKFFIIKNKNKLLLYFYYIYNKLCRKDIKLIIIRNWKKISNKGKKRKCVRNNYYNISDK